MADAKPVGEYTAPIVQRLLAQRRRFDFICDRNWFEGAALALVIGRDWKCTVVYLVIFDWRLGALWRHA